MIVAVSFLISRIASFSAFLYFFLSKLLSVFLRSFQWPEMRKSASIRGAKVGMAFGFCLFSCKYSSLGLFYPVVARESHTFSISEQVICGCMIASCRKAWISCASSLSSSPSLKQVDMRAGLNLTWPFCIFMMARSPLTSLKYCSLWLSF